jgi:hypothetical protein
MDRSRSGNGVVRSSSRKRNTEGNAIRLESLRSDEVTVELGILEPGKWQRRADGDQEEAHAMLELNFDVHRDQVTLRSVNSGSGVEVRGEEQMWEHRHSRNSAISAILARSGSYTAHSTSFRESIKTVGNMVKQFSNEIMRTSRGASSRVLDLGHPDAPLAALPIDPELGHGAAAPDQMQKSASTAEHAIQGLKEISKATATADQRKSWEQVEARFQKLATPEGMLPRSNFAECIGEHSTIPLIRHRTP